MKQNKLLFCSALLFAPLCGLTASDSEKALDKKSKAAFELRQDAMADLSTSLDLSCILPSIKSTASTDFNAVNPLLEVSIFKQMPNKQMPNRLMAHAEEETEASISENEAADSFEKSATKNPKGERSAPVS